MGRIIISRELSFYHSISPIKVYVDGQFVKKLHREGNVMEYPIQADSAQVSIREWGFKTKPAMVRDGQSVLIKPHKLFIFLYFAAIILLFIFWWKWSTSHLWPDDQWNTPEHFWYRTALQFILLIPTWLNSVIPLFKLEVIHGLPSGYIPEDKSYA